MPMKIKSLNNIFTKLGILIMNSYALEHIFNDENIACIDRACQTQNADYLLCLKTRYEIKKSTIIFTIFTIISYLFRFFFFCISIYWKRKHELI